MNGFAELRELLAQKTSAVLFEQIIQLFEKWPKNKERTIAIDYALEHLRSWNPLHRHLFVQNLSMLKKLAPFWPLVRSIHYHATHSKSTISENFTSFFKEFPIARIHLSGFSKVKDISFLKDYSELEEIVLDDFRNVQDLSFLPSLKKLKTLTLLHCIRLDCSFLSQLSGLEHLTLSNYNMLKSLDLRSVAPTLKTLDLRENPRLQFIQGLNFLCSLQTLVLLDSPQIVWANEKHDFASLKRMSISLQKDREIGWFNQDDFPQLEDLLLSNCNELVSIHALEQISSLFSLQIEGCPHLDSIEGIQGCKNLRLLRVERCNNLRNFQALSALVALEKLEIISYQNNSSVAFLKDLKNLEDLLLSGFLFASFEQNDSLPRLKKCFLDNMSNLQEVRLENSPRLEDLGFLDCRKLKTLPSFQFLTNLQRLSLSNCEQIQDITELKHCKNLVYLDFFGSFRIKDWSAISYLTELETLILSYTSVQDFSFLNQEMKKLTWLQAQFCQKLHSTKGIRWATHLQKLNLYACGNLKSLEELDQCTSLQEINLSDCTKLSNISNISSLSSLKYLGFFGCAIQDPSALLALEKIEQCDCYSNPFWEKMVDSVYQYHYFSPSLFKTLQEKIANIDWKE